MWSDYATPLYGINVYPTIIFVISFYKVKIANAIFPNH